MADVTVGIDIGTTAVKAIAADGDGTVVARARVPHGFLTPAADELEHDARRAWRTGPRRALTALGVDPLGICVSAMVPSLAPVNRRGVPIGPGLLYGDARGRNDSGLPDPLGQFPAFVGWAAREFPAAHSYWPAQAVASVALGGEPVVDGAVAGTGFPLFDGAGWNAEQCAALGVRPEQLPRVGQTGEAAGRVGRAVLAPGVVDGMAEPMVAGADREGDVLVLFGATLIVFVMSGEFRSVPGMMTIPQPNGMCVIGGPSNAGGLFVDWARHLAVRGGGEAAPSSIPVWLPYARGERAPYNDPAKRSSLHDLHMAHGPSALRRSMFEASAFVVRHLVDLTGVNPRRVVATGGGTRDPEWMRAVADVTGLPVDVVAVPEGAALGAAFLARIAAGLESSPDDARRWAKTAHTVEPDGAWVGPCRQRYERFRALSDAP
jgi:xylulokinase